MQQRNFLSRQLMPPEIRGAEVGSFAHSTVSLRLASIAQRVIDENSFPPEIVGNLQTLIQELPQGIVRELKDTESPDFATWKSYLEPYKGLNWLDIPWYFAEAYFYRRILEATNYFKSGSWQGIDPFVYQKQMGLETAIDGIIPLSAFVNQWGKPELDDDDKKDALIKLLYFDLWGNRADLSLWPAGEAEENRIESNRETAYILVDDTAKIAEKVASFKLARIDLIVDNAGFELVGDLCLADFLLSTNAAAVVYLHLKAHPTFVSDAMIKDVQYTIDQLLQASDLEVRSLAVRLQNYLDNHQLKCCENLFWTSPLALWEMPDGIYEELSKSNLIVLKGDANYRRSLGDRHWPFTIDYQDIVSYFPAPLVALRTLKSEIATGLKSEQIEYLNQQDPQWLTNGQWGVIQFVDPVY